MTTSTYANPGNCCTPETGINLAVSFARFLAHLKLRNRQYRDFRHLSEMTDDQLRDIGLQRTDIRDAVFGRGLDHIRNEVEVRR
jgi:uncharacterized protein YjiS (DUF1127 family)